MTAQQTKAGLLAEFQEKLTQVIGNTPSGSPASHQKTLDDLQAIHDFLEKNDWMIGSLLMDIIDVCVCKLNGLAELLSQIAPEQTTRQ